MGSASVIHSNVPLSDYTTIGLGGPATHFSVCESLDQVRECLIYARAHGLRVFVLGGGSNIIFSDAGFRGLVLKIALGGVALVEDGTLIRVTVAAGEPWDPFVRYCVDHHLAGLECLSGIPGLAGATPIQNVGAYGQEVKDTIVSVKALHRDSLTLVEFSGKECKFAYRHSRFKSEDRDTYIITEVTFRLIKHGRPEIRYPELRKYVESRTDGGSGEGGEPTLDAVRRAVLTLRRRKSMVVEPADTNCRSVGSFFVNPVFTHEEFRRLEANWKSSGMTDPVPTFAGGEYVKIPAAWLVEKSGFHKGYRRGGVGISANHALALVNFGGSTHEILDLAADIQEQVHKRFGVRLEREPVVVDF